MIKRILWCFQKFARNEILESPLIFQLKVHDRLAFEQHNGILYILDVFCLESPPSPPVVLNAFFFDKTFCLVIITYLWSQFRNLTFSFWFVIYSFVCFLVIECHLLSCQSQTLIFVQFARKKQWNRISLSDLDYFLTFVQWRRCAKIFLYRN